MHLYLKQKNNYVLLVQTREQQSTKVIKQQNIVAEDNKGSSKCQLIVHPPPQHVTIQQAVQQSWSTGTVSNCYENKFT